MYCISHVYAHHAAASGYHLLAGHLGPTVQPTPVVRWLGNTVLRVPAKVASWTCGVYEYSRHNCIGELAVGLDLLRKRGAIYHFLYGEKGYRFSGRLNGLRGNVLMGTFHHAPSRFDEMLPSKRHLRHLEHAIAVGVNQIEMLERVVGAGKVSYVPHGIDTNYWRPLEGARGEGPWRCVFAGIHMRDYATLETAVRRLRGARDDIEFTLLCKDERCAAVAEMEGVRWLKRTSDEEYRRIIRESDVMLLPLTDSTAVNSVLEAIACGVPVVTSDGGIREYLNDECGRVHRVGDAEGMAESVLEMVSDGDRLRQMQERARARALELDWSRIAEEMKSVYRRMGGA